MRGKNQYNSDPPTREILERLYVSEGLSCKDIAIQLGFSTPTIHRWLQRYGLPVRSRSEARKIAKAPTYSPEGLAAKQAVATEMRARVTAEGLARGAAKKRGRPAYNRGVPMGEEQRQKLIEQRSDPEYRRIQSERFRGENSPNWKGGVKSELNRRLDTAEWRRTRQLVYARDNWTCLACGRKCKNTADSKNDGKAKIQAHHILARRHGGSDALENLITVCMSCHHKIEKNVIPCPLPAGVDSAG